MEADVNATSKKSMTLLCNPMGNQCPVTVAIMNLRDKDTLWTPPLAKSTRPNIGLVSSLSF